MANQTTLSGEVYIYAVVPSSEEKELGVKGLFDGVVHTLSFDGVAAVVSEVSGVEKVRPERRHLAAHQGVLSYLIQDGRVVLPVSFGTISDSPEAVRKMLSRYSKTFNEQINKVSGKVELELRVNWDVPNLFEYFLVKHPELKAERDRVYGSGKEPSRDEKIDLGKLFEEILDKERERLTAKVEKALSSVCDEIKRNKCRNEMEVMRLSCLFSGSNLEQVEEAINEVSREFDDNYLFEYSGPLPPYNFVDVRVKV